MEVIFGGALYKSKSLEATPRIKPNDRDLSARDSGHKMEPGKKRGVYVEKWNQKHAEGSKPHRKPKTGSPRAQTQKLLTSAPAESKIYTFTRLLGTADPAIRFIKHKAPHKTYPGQLSKHNSRTSPTKHSKPGTNKHSVEEKKTRLIHKVKDARKGTPLASPDPTPTPSFVAIFPNRENSTGNAHLLQQYICNPEQNAEIENHQPKSKDLQDASNYNFLADLIDSVYDTEQLSDDDKLSSKSSHVQFDIDVQVGKKLQSLETYHYTIKDDNFTYDQSRQLAEYYNNRSHIPPPRHRPKLNRNKRHAPVKPTLSTAGSKSKKPNLLNILKEQLSFNCDVQEEPETMYEALLNIAKNKSRRTKIYFEAADLSYPEPACRFKRRNVISPSTRLKKFEPIKFLNSVNTTRGKYQTGSLASSDYGSRLSLQVLGFEYDDQDIMNLAESSDAEVSRARPLNLNEGITTVTQCWKC